MQPLWYRNAVIYQVDGIVAVLGEVREHALPDVTVA